MPLIIIITMISFIILIIWMWKNLGQIENSKKIVTIIVSILIIFIITLIVFNISKSNINYDNNNIQRDVRNVIVFVFSIVNGLIILPFVAKILGKINENEIEKEDFTKKILLIVVIFIIILFFECGYMKNTQEGILKVYNSMK